MSQRAKGISSVVVAALLLVVGFQGRRVGASQAQSEEDGSLPGLSFVRGRVLVQFRAQTLAVQESNVVEELGAGDAGEITGTKVHVLELPDGANERAVLKALRSRPDVEFAELDRIIPPAEIAPNDPWYPNEWHLPQISAPTAWSMTTGSANVIVAICDTGVNASHPDLAANIIPGWNVYNNNSDTSDVLGHGTLVAGTVGAIGNNQTGVASVAWRCSLMPIRVSDPNGNAAYSAIANGITWAANHGARVANVSYMATDSSTVRSAAQYMQSRGGVVTAAAGNSGTFDSSPDNPYIITVSMTDYTDTINSGSNTGNNVDLAAPDGVYSTNRAGGYSYVGGTSFSAPIVAGVAALVLSLNPGLTGSEVQDILKRSADDLGPAGWDPSYGWGRVNAARAVSLASGGGGGPDTTPPTISFSSPSSGATVSGVVSVQVAAADNVGVTSVSLSVDGALFGGDSTAPYTFSWDTTRASNGAHILTATAQDAAGNASNTSITVTVQNGGDITAPTISVASPTNGATVSGNVSVIVNAADNVRVVRVELYVDGSLVATSTSSPFTTKWNTRRETAGVHNLQGKAYDAAGNVGYSQVVTVYR